MNKKIIVKKRQSLLDISLQQTGGMEMLLEIANANNKSITDELGESELLVTGKIQNKNVANYYKENHIYPATGLTDEITGGIGFMGVQIDFKIS